MMTLANGACKKTQEFQQNWLFLSIFSFDWTRLAGIPDNCRKSFWLKAQVMRAGDGFDGRAVIAAAKWYGGCRP